MRREQHRVAVIEAPSLQHERKEKDDDDDSATTICESDDDLATML